MELKQCSICDLDEEYVLLIVPYGIETIILKNKQQSFILLIVPYGIET